MSHRGLLPGGGVPLPPEYTSPPPVHPKYKAIILYFMYFAGKAANEAEPREARALQSCAHIPASALLKKVYSIDIPPKSINDYYLNVMAKAEAIGDWDDYAVARIISRLVQDYETYTEVISFLQKAVEHWDHLTLIEQFFLQKISIAAGGPKGESPAFLKLTSFVYAAVTPNDFYFPDPEFKQPRDVKLETSNQYGHLRDLEKRLKKNPSVVSVILDT